MPEDEENEEGREIIAEKARGGSKALRAQDRQARKQAAQEAAGEAEGPLRVQLPDHKNKELFAIADQLLGASKMIVMCEDGKSRMARIPGKMKRRMWIKPGDLIIVRPWDIDDSKADVQYRYLRTQSAHLSRRGLIPELLDQGF